MGKGRRRGRQEGSIYLRADGRWTAAIDCGWKNGKRVRKQFYGNTRKAVQDELTKGLRDQQLGVPVAVKRQTVAAFLQTWLDSRKTCVRSKTLGSYTQLITSHISPSLGRVELTKLTPQHVQAFMTEALGKGLSPRSVQYARAVLRAALNRAMKWGLIQRNVAALVDPPRRTAKAIEPFSVEQIPALLQAFEKHRLGPLFLLALAHGLRQGEALGLRWCDVDLDGRTLSVRHTLQWDSERKPQLLETKTKRSRRNTSLSIQVTAALKVHRVRQLEDRMKAGDKWSNSLDLIFTTRGGGPLDGINVTRDFKRMLRAAGMPPKRFHDLRHTTASLLLHEQVHPRVVMELLGHSEIRVTMDLYSHVAPVLEREAADRMDGLFQTATAQRQ